MYQKANSLIQLNKLQDAQQIYQEIISINPKHEISLQKLGDILLNQKFYLQAQQGMFKINLLIQSCFIILSKSHLIRFIQQRIFLLLWQNFNLQIIKEIVQVHYKDIKRLLIYMIKYQSKIKIMQMQLQEKEYVYYKQSTLQLLDIQVGLMKHKQIYKSHQIEKQLFIRIIWIWNLFIVY
ncbi:unnamed protein product [Paramecium primaurelia]|uniref:Tetratricopeptide repeat protein n=1 Tax=Paramecium primaurelia TaxID=5886 RepID=A0A8S1QKV9_PARPR|nr:unnamed protein product [Paramecium primaurelia]